MHLFTVVSTALDIFNQRDKTKGVTNVLLNTLCSGPREATSSAEKGYITHVPPKGKEVTSRLRFTLVFNV